MGQRLKKLVRKLIFFKRSILKWLELDKDELEALSKLLVDIAKGALGVPLVVYLVPGFSRLVLVGALMLDLVVVIICLIVAHALHKAAKRR